MLQLQSLHMITKQMEVPAGFADFLLCDAEEHGTFDTAALGTCATSLLVQCKTVPGVGKNPHQHKYRMLQKVQYRPPGAIYIKEDAHLSDKMLLHDVWASSTGFTAAQARTQNKEQQLLHARAELEAVKARQQQLEANSLVLLTSSNLRSSHTTSASLTEVCLAAF